MDEQTDFYGPLKPSDAGTRERNNCANCGRSVINRWQVTYEEVEAAQTFQSPIKAVLLCCIKCTQTAEKTGYTIIIQPSPLSYFPGVAA